MDCAQLYPDGATRAAGLARLDAFLPHAGRPYAAGRNIVREGPAATTSGLSPYLQRRLVGEHEVIDAVLAARPDAAASAEKFLQEVVWRTYWKGWLERRPGVWRAYQQELAARRPSAAARAALDGRSGLACLDAWTAELRQTGWLHNHVRMWFASLWCFTLALPWALGAELFRRHLVDADVASNTLSWRWVVGLQTRGKIYVATADNIDRCTEGRVRPAQPLASAAQAAALAAEAATADAALQAADADAAADAEADALGPLPAALPAGRWGLLVHPEDLSVETSELGACQPAAVACLDPAWASSPEPLPRAFGAAAADDGAARLGRHFGGEIAHLRPSGAGAAAELAAAVAAWRAAQRLDGVVCAAPFVGPWRDVMAPLLAAPGCRAGRRAHDLALFPHATRGFFHLKKRLPAHLAARRRARMS